MNARDIGYSHPTYKVLFAIILFLGLMGSVPISSGCEKESVKTELVSHYKTGKVISAQPSYSKQKSPRHSFLFNEAARCFTFFTSQVLKLYPKKLSDPLNFSFHFKYPSNDEDSISFLA